MIEKLLFTTAAPHHLENDVIDESWARMRDRNKDWKIILFSDSQQEQFLRERLSPRVFKAYQSINPSYGAARADFFRYCACFLLGGIYIDVKSHIAQPLNQLVRSDDQFLISQWDNRPGQVHASTWGRREEIEDVMGGEFVQWLIISRPKHPFLQAVIETVVSHIEAERQNSVVQAVGWKGVLKVTGPIAFTRAIADVIGDGTRFRNNQDYRYFNFWEHSCYYSIFEPSFMEQQVRGQGWKSLDEGSANAWHRLCVEKHYSRNVEPVVLPLKSIV